MRCLPVSFILCVILLPVMATAESTRYVNARVYTLNGQEVLDEICVVNGLIASSAQCAGASAVDLNGHTVIPGFIEGHGHLMSIGFEQLNLNLVDAANYQDLVNRVATAVDRAEPGEWIIGRGWHQSKWSPAPELVGGFQTHHRLSEVSPDNPVFLVHASGHAAFVNQRAMSLAGIDESTRVDGDGEVIKDENGQPTGILNEMAQSLVSPLVPEPTDAQREQALSLALQALAQNGVTSFQDAGSGQADIDLFKLFAANDRLTARLWVMLQGSDAALLDRWFSNGPEVGLWNDYLTIRAVKLVADGALGSRGAWLLAPYTDMPDQLGLPTMAVETMSDISHRAYQSGFQVGIHAIGDRANREVLNIFDDLFDGKDRGVRFRIEHAQHIHSDDIPRFGELGVIASMQGIHMSSDRPWAIDRLGKARIESGAYMWRDLQDSGAVIVNGTDAPVEPVNPIASYYSLVTRKTLGGKPPGGYEPAQKLDRWEALRAYTINAAYGAFEEQLKGELVPGKKADFVVLNQDIVAVAEDQLLNTRVLMTVVGGKSVYLKDL